MTSTKHTPGHVQGCQGFKGVKVWCEGCERLMNSAQELLDSAKIVADRLSAWRDGANISYQQTGDEKAYNEHGNYDQLLSGLQSAIAKAEGRP